MDLLDDIPNWLNDDIGLRWVDEDKALDQYAEEVSNWNWTPMKKVTIDWIKQDMGVNSVTPNVIRKYCAKKGMSNPTAIRTLIENLI